MGVDKRPEKWLGAQSIGLHKLRRIRVGRRRLGGLLEVKRLRRPVLAQDTGIASLYPIGEGLLTFSTLDEAATGVEAITKDYSKHSRAARELAEEFFDSDKVLTALLEKLSA